MIITPRTNEWVAKWVGLIPFPKAICELLEIADGAETELFKAKAEAARLREEVAMMRECIISTEDTAGQRE